MFIENEALELQISMNRDRWRSEQGLGLAKKSQRLVSLLATAFEAMVDVDKEDVDFDSVV